MTIWHLIIREAAFRKGSAVVAVGTAALAVAAAVAILSLLRAHEAKAHHLAEQREQETLLRMDAMQDAIHNAMKGLGFNVSLIPRGQDTSHWLSADYGAQRMPYAHAETLRGADLTTLKHITAQLRRSLEWPETRWRVIVVGTEGRIDGQDRSQNRGTPEAIPSGTVWLGHEIWRGLDLATNQTLTIAGTSFRIGRCLPQEGSRDDITLWMALDEAQALFDEPGVINEIAAVGTHAAWADSDAIDEETGRLLPDMQSLVNAPKIAATLRSNLSLERDTLAMNRLEAQTQAQLAQTRKHLALLLNILMAVIGGGWIGLLAYGNARDRSIETALWSALGMPHRRLALLLAAKWAGLCFAGALLGAAAGQALFLLTRPVAPAGAYETAVYVDIVGAALALALGLAALAAGVPVRVAAHQDPSTMLREDMI